MGETLRKLINGGHNLSDVLTHAREAYRREIDPLDYDGLLAEARYQMESSKWRLYEVKCLAERRGYFDEPKTCWERIMGEGYWT